jgi:tRNA(Ile)-lysidine synthase
MNANSRKKTSKTELSEEDLRQIRYEAFKAVLPEDAYLALAHHADDLFETRLIRLMRGTGPQGLGAMTELDQGLHGIRIWRPLLGVLRLDLEAYLEAYLGTTDSVRGRKQWVEDPSNRQDAYLRNGIRNKLVPLLNKLRPGSAQAMARSLDLIAEAFAVVEPEAVVEAVSLERAKYRERRVGVGFEEESMGDEADGVFLDRALLLKLERIQRRYRLSRWLFEQDVRGYSKGQIEEVLKRIDTPQKRLTFQVGGLVWKVDGDRLSFESGEAPFQRS